MKHITYGVVGRGRVATHIIRYLELEGLPVRQWHRGQACAADSSLRNADVVLLAIGDDALEPFLRAQPGIAGKTCLHFSGSRTVAGASGFHPLMTFGPEPYDLETYRRIPFVIELGGPGFEDIFPTLVNPSWPIDAELKPLYHALCVLAGNFPTLLWNKVFGAFEGRLGVPRSALTPYLERTLENTLESGDAALTGPLARGDTGTIDLNLEALEGDSYQDVYRAFVDAHGLQETGT